MAEEEESLPETEMSNKVEDKGIAQSEMLQSEVQKQENNFKSCLDDIPFDKWIQKNIDECLGEKMITVVQSCKFVELKFLATKEAAIKDVFKESCYEEAEDDLKAIEDCELLE